MGIILSEEIRGGILGEIVSGRLEEIERIRLNPGYDERFEALKSKAESVSPCVDFASAIRGEGIKIIAEVKKASPSRGVIRKDFDPLAMAQAYERGGAAAISVLTDKRHFQGSLEYLTAISSATALPLLRKDFIVDPYQVYESRANGADAVLLIVAILDDGLLSRLYELSKSLGMEVLVEVHTEEDVDRALKVGAEVIGINNRNLKSFEVSLETTERLVVLLPDSVIKVSESGIMTASDIERLRGHGVDAFLVGEALSAAEDIEAKLGELLSRG